MPKGKVLQESEVPNRKENQKKLRITKRKKSLKFNGWNLLRFSLMIFLAGIIVHHYYLFTENQLMPFYQNLWRQNKQVLFPIFIVIAYTITIFLVGFSFGKRR